MPAPAGLPGSRGSFPRASVRVAVQCRRPSLTGFPAVQSSGFTRGPRPSAEAQGHWTRCPAYLPTGRTAQRTRIPKRLPAETSLPPPDPQKQRIRLRRSARTGPRRHSPGGSTFAKASSTSTATLGHTPDYQLRNETTRPSGRSQDSGPGLSACKALFLPTKITTKGPEPRGAGKGHLSPPSLWSVCHAGGPCFGPSHQGGTASHGFQDSSPRPHTPP